MLKDQIKTDLLPPVSSATGPVGARVLFDPY
jgi:hypothetical protein